MNASLRISSLFAIAVAIVSIPAAGAEQAAAAAAARDGQHDFDFKNGTWTTHIRRLRHPLSGSHEWIELNGTVTTHKVWGGRALLEEVEADGPDGHFEDLGLFLYNPGTHQWSMFFATGNDGVMGTPMFGEFKDGRGEFYDQETFNDRAILVRFVISNLSANACHFEQAFSADGGQTWEVNWIADDTRQSE